MSEVRYEVSAGGVAVITLDAPQRRNALTPQMAADLVLAMEDADGDDAVGALVVSGGASFCAGADLGTLSNAGADPAEDMSVRAIEDIYAAFLRLGRVQVPTIAAVRGAAVGAGLNLALTPDLRVVAQDARLMSGFDRVGLHPGGGHFVLLSRVGGRETAAAMGLFGEQVNGSKAAEMGIAWKAVDDTDVDKVALDLAHRSARDPALTRRVVASFRRETGPPGLPWDVGVELERASQMWSSRRQATTQADDSEL